MASRRAFGEAFANFSRLPKVRVSTPSSKWNKSLQAILSKPSMRQWSSSSKLLRALSQERICSSLAFRNFQSSVAAGKSLQLPPLLIAAGGTEIECMDAIAALDDDDTFSLDDDALSGTIMCLLQNYSVR